MIRIPILPDILRFLADRMSGNDFNWRGLPSNYCYECGSTLFTIQAEFDDDFEISGYLLNAKCAHCGNKVTAPTPLDKIDIIEE